MGEEGHASNVRHCFLYRQYTNLFMIRQFRFVSQHCLRSTLVTFISFSIFSERTDCRVWITIVKSIVYGNEIQTIVLKVDTRCAQNTYTFTYKAMMISQ